MPAQGITRLKRRLIKKFGGLTHFPQKAKGSWRIGHVIFTDAIIIIRVLSEKDEKQFWSELKADLQNEWKQKEILIIVRNVVVLP